MMEIKGGNGARRQAETGSRASTGPVARPGPAGFDPARVEALAKELGELRDHIKRSWDDVAKSEADSSWAGGWGIEERLNACMFVGKQTTMVVYQALDKIVAALASGTDARSGETEGLDPKDDGPVPKADAQGASQ